MPEPCDHFYAELNSAGDMLECQDCGELLTDDSEDELGDWQPIPPSNVRIVYANGREVACPVKYLGYDQFTEGSSDKHFGWRVLNEGPFDARIGDHIAYDSGSVPMYIECPGTGPSDA